MTLTAAERRITRVIDSLFTHMGLPATYHRWGVDHLPVTVIVKPVDPYIELNDRPMALSANRLEVRVAELVTPQRGHHFTVGEQIYQIDDEPVTAVHERVWSMTVLPVAAKSMRDLHV